MLKHSLVILIAPAAPAAADRAMASHVVRYQGELSFVEKSNAPAGRFASFTRSHGPNTELSSSRMLRLRSLKAGRSPIALSVKAWAISPLSRHA